MGQSGNAWEWMETEFDGVNDSSGSSRGLRGGSWSGSSFLLPASSRYDFFAPTLESSGVGFRVASVPEPSAVLLTFLAAGASLTRRRRSLL